MSIHDKLRTYVREVDFRIIGYIFKHRAWIQLHIYLILFSVQLLLYISYLFFIYYQTHSFYDLIVEHYGVHTKMSSLDTPKIFIFQTTPTEPELVEPPKITPQQATAIQNFLEMIAPSERTQPTLKLPPFQTKHYDSLFPCGPKYYLKIPLTTVEHSCCCNLPIMHYHSNHLVLSSPKVASYINGSIIVLLQAVALALPIKAFFSFPIAKKIQIIQGDIPIVPWDWNIVPFAATIWIGLLVINRYYNSIPTVMYPPVGQKHFPVIDGFISVRKRPDGVLLCGACPYPLNNGLAHHDLLLFTSQQQHDAFVHLGEQDLFTDEKYKVVYHAIKNSVVHITL